MKKEIIAIDLGGTQLRAARYDATLNLLAREHMPTGADDGLAAVLARIKAIISLVMPASRDQVDSIGISAPGPLNSKTGVIVSPPNLPGWHHVPLGAIIEAAFGLPVYIGNDANVAALAEASQGAAQGCRHVCYITVSTGIGSGIICDGRLVTGQAGLAAELGHIPIIVAAGKVSSIEKEAAGPAIARRARQALIAGDHTAMLAMVAGDPQQLDARVVGAAARHGDRLAIDLLAEAGRIIGLGIVTALHLFNPQIIVIGGGVSKTGELLFAPIRQTVRDHALDSAFLGGLRIEAAALGDDVALVGAAALAATQGGDMDIGELDQRF
ncbi:MAG: ROK family protein [Chloroflexi bacterium]|nr:ROK family protein [Chloroflexota bacterium]MCY4248395.1 ROK family protein [Chloroflexota bacterium]